MELKLTPVKYRIMGAVIDGLINLGVILLILILTSTADIITILFTKNTSAVLDAVSLIKLLGAGLLIEIYFIGYLVVLPLVNKGATIGQRLFHMAMVKEDGKNVDFKTLFVRQVVGNTLVMVSTFMAASIVSLLLMMFRKDNASIADIVGKTYVIDCK
ncbi:MAG: RDD family protein [Bacilli bacterium]|nr:RDD family protein [Bacilli bacterium]